MSGMSKLILAKRKLGRSLLSKARQLQRPDYLPFISPERRRARIYCLRAEAKRQLEGAQRLQGSKGPHGPRLLGLNLPGSI
jgi:hypothetical protein